MKRIICLLIFFLFSTTLIYSQNTISIGLKSSYNSSNINFYNNFFPQNIGTSSFYDFSFSFITEIKNKKNTGIRIEISKMNKGWVGDTNNKIYTSEISYLNVPVTMSTYFGNKKTKINFLLGPFFEYQLSNNSDYLLSEISDLDIYFDDLRDNKWGYGLMTSAGLSFNLNKNHFQFLVSYQYNFDNLIDVKIKNALIPDISNFNTLSLSFVYLFNFDKNEI
tara:strand:+ start:2994 stop:3656 length:663 start_codon:yes stop_codon:yes gene_type:complete